VLPGRIHLSIRRRFGSEVVVVKVLPAASKAGMLSLLWVQVRLGLFHLPLHCLRWEIGEPRPCYLIEDAGGGVFKFLEFAFPGPGASGCYGTFSLS
jgi:hypothetical protein